MQNIGTLAIEEWLSVIKNTFKHIPYGLKNEQELSKLFSKITQEELYLSLIYYFQRKLKAQQLEREIQAMRSDEDEEGDRSMRDEED